MNDGDRIVGAIGYVGSEHLLGTKHNDPYTMYGVSFTVYNEHEAKELQRSTTIKEMIVPKRIVHSEKPAHIPEGDVKIYQEASGDLLTAVYDSTLMLKSARSYTRD